MSLCKNLQSTFTALFLLIAALMLSLSPRDAHSQAFTMLHTFSALDVHWNNLEGARPYAGLIQASDGALYGTCSTGGSSDNGTIFRVTTGGQFTTLHSFSAIDYDYHNADGAYPYAGLIQASDGALYGTCSTGGAYNGGTIFRVTTGGQFTTLYSFSARDGSFNNTDGAFPYAGLIQASDGALYGTCFVGGQTGNGTIFRVTTGGQFTTLYSFSAMDREGKNLEGGNPGAGLIQAVDGALYGTCTYGGANDRGSIFRITLGGQFTTLHTFSPWDVNGNNLDGAFPQAALIQASDGALYGTCREGGSTCNGSIFRITTGGQFTTLYRFAGLDSSYRNADGVWPFAELIQASDGALYGACYGGGAYSGGTIFRITTDGQLMTLYSFGSGSDGFHPFAALNEASDGAFYGTCSDGGAHSSGTVFKLQMPLYVVSTSLAPGTLVGGYPSTLTVTLSGPAPAGGAEVALKSSNAAARVPASVIIAAGRTSATATATTSPVTATTVVSIAAAHAISTVTSTLTLRAPRPVALDISPAAVTAGTGATGTITLNSAAPPGGTVVTLKGSSSAATFPASVTVPAGASTAQFAISTSGATADSTRVIITATARGRSINAALSVQPAVTFTGMLGATRIRGGNPVSLSVILAKPAPAGGLTFALASDNVAASPQFALLTIPAGQSRGTRPIVTQAVTSSVMAHITVSLGTTSHTATLAVTP